MTRKRVDDVKNGPTQCQSQCRLRDQANERHTDPAESQKIRRHDLQGPHLALVMRMRVRNFGGWEKGQAEMDQGDKHRSQSDLMHVSLRFSRRLRSYSQGPRDNLHAVWVPQLEV